MRSLKFRAWDKENEVYLDIDETFLIAGKGLPARFVQKFGYTADENLELEQYTGLKDKNGKEIYEGDIVYDIYTGDEVFIVGWDKDKASFMLADTADYPMAYFDEYELDKDLEVIGNVHENPELIGGEE